MKRVFVQLNSVAIANTGEFGALQVTADCNAMIVHDDNTITQCTYSVGVPFNPLTVTRENTYEAIRAALFDRINTDYADWGVNLTGYDTMWSGGDLFFAQPV